MIKCIDNTNLFLISQGQTIQKYDLNKEEMFDSFEVYESIDGFDDNLDFCITEDSQFIITSWLESIVKIIELSGYKTVCEIDTKMEQLGAPIMDQAGKYFAISGCLRDSFGEYQARVKIYDYKTGECIQEIETGSKFSDIYFFDSLDKMYVFNFSDIDGMKGEIVRLSLKNIEHSEIIFEDFALTDSFYVIDKKRYLTVQNHVISLFIQKNSNLIWSNVIDTYPLDLKVDKEQRYLFVVTYKSVLKFDLLNEDFVVLEEIEILYDSSYDEASISLDMQYILRKDEENHLSSFILP